MTPFGTTGVRGNDGAPGSSGGLRPGVRVGLIAAALAAGALLEMVVHQPVKPPEGFSFAAPPASPVALPPAAARVRAQWINPDPLTTTCHASSIALMPDGSMATVWWGGTREGAADVSLYLSRRPAGLDTEWTPPELLLSPEAAESEIARNIRKLGNAVLFADPQARLWLVYVSVSVGGWSGSALNVKRSDDGGRTWTASQRLSLGPFFNFSTLVRSKPFFSSDGWIALPVYHEFVRKHAEILWWKPGEERSVGQFHIRHAAVRPGLMQPSVVTLDHTRGVMVLRDTNDSRRLTVSSTGDAGWTWTAPEEIALQNPDAGVDLLKLSDGRLLLAYNEGHTGRHRLRLAVSRDEGRTWQPGPYVENEDSGEYSYPSLALDLSGNVHLTYTWRRERIRHVTFSAAWLDQPVVAISSL